MNSIDRKPFDRSELKACAICGKRVLLRFLEGSVE